MAFFKTNVKSNESITSSRPNSSENPTNYTNCTTVDQLCRIVAAENKHFVPPPKRCTCIFMIFFRNINMSIDGKYPDFKIYTITPSID